MTRILLIHWNDAEWDERADRLRRAGHAALNCRVREGGQALRRFRDDPPDAVVIDLSRLPSHGRAVGVFLRQQKGTRHVPLVFLEGDPDKVERVRRELPDAVYSDWKHVRGALRQAMQNPPPTPHVPVTMGAYSSTPLPRKLGVRDGSHVVLLGGPDDLEGTVSRGFKGVRLARQLRGRPDLIVLFCKSTAELRRRLPAASRAMADGGALWLAWPKQASGVRTDLTRAAVRRVGLAAGLVDYKVCSIDDTWSGLRFARRR